MTYKVIDDQEKAEDEFESYGYSECLVDANGDVQGIFVDGELARKVAELLNKDA